MAACNPDQVCLDVVAEQQRKAEQDPRQVPRSEAKQAQEAHSYLAISIGVVRKARALSVHQCVW